VVGPPPVKTGRIDAASFGGARRGPRHSLGACGAPTSPTFVLASSHTAASRLSRSVMSLEPLQASRAGAGDVVSVLGYGSPEPLLAVLFAAERVKCRQRAFQLR
jgi:hypothetical protein